MTEHTPAALVDRDGNLILHARGGAVITIDFVDAAGAALDVSARTLWFEVAGVVRVTCAAGANTAQRIVTLTRANVQAIGGATAATPSKAPFALIDETSTPLVLWSGDARLQGFAAQPV